MHRYPGADNSEMGLSGGDHKTESTGFNGDLNTGSASISSTASGHSRSTGTSLTFSKVIQDFKNSISRRQTPKHLVRMGRLLGLVILATIAISIIDFDQKMTYVVESIDLC